MKRFTVWALLLLATFGTAVPAAAEPAVAETAAGLFCAAAAPAEAPAAEAEGGLFSAEPKALCTVACVNDDPCRKDSDCTAAPGGTCNLICPRNGCCVY